MVQAAITNANVVVSKGAYTVTIAVTGNEDVLLKNLSKITPATSPQNFGSGQSPTLLIDLLRIERNITINGFLATGVNTKADGDSSETAAGKKSDLQAIFNAGGVVSMTYPGEASALTGNIEKLSIKTVPSDGLTTTEGSASLDKNYGEVEFSIQFNFIVGVNIPNPP